MFIKMAKKRGKKKVCRKEKKHCRAASDKDKNSKVKKMMKLSKPGKGGKVKKETKKGWWFWSKR